MYGYASPMAAITTTGTGVGLAYTVTNSLGDVVMAATFLFLGMALIYLLRRRHGARP
jgi:hypothetical protein